MKIIRTLAVYIYLAVVVLRGIPYFKRLEKNREQLGDAVVQEKVHRFAQRMARRIMALTGSKITVKGRENLPRDGATLYVANHQSYMDIPVVLSILEQPAGFVAKEEIGNIPFFHHWLEAMKCVLIARGETRRALAAILEAAKLLSQGHSLVLFPEGTRSADGTLGEFKAGSLKAAQRGKSIIVPLAIDGARDIMPRDSIWMNRHEVTVTVLPAIDAQTVQSMDTKELAALVKGQIGQALGQEIPETTTEKMTAGDGAEIHG